MLDMLAPEFDFDALILFDGSPVASARQMLEDGHYAVEDDNPAAPVLRFEDQSVARSYDFGGPLRSIHPVFYATYCPAIDKFKIRVCGMNTNTETLQDVTGDIEILIGHEKPVSVYKRAALYMPFATWWTKRFWIGGEPEKVNEETGFADLVARRMVPNFDPAMKAALMPSTDARYKQWLASPHDIGEKGLWGAMNGPGARKDIGIHPGWMVAWLHTGSWQDREIALGMADLMGGWKIYLTEGDPSRMYDRAKTIPALGRPISMHARPTDDLSGWTQKRMPTIKMHSPATGGFMFQAAHSPDPFSLAYMLTRDPWYLRCLQMYAAGDAMSEAPQSTDAIVPKYATALRVAKASDGSGVIAGYDAELRSNAWASLHRHRAGFLSPEGSPEKAYFGDILKDMLAVWSGQKGLASPLSGTTAYRWGQKTNVGVFALNYFMQQNIGPDIRNREPGNTYVHGPTTEGACYQTMFLTCALGEMEEHGVPGATELLDYVAKWSTGPLDEGFAPGSVESKLPFTYWVPLRAGGVINAAYTDAAGVLHPEQVGGVGPYFTSWAQVRDEHMPADLALRIKSFDILNGDFAVLGYAASTFITKRPNGAVLCAWLKSAVHDKPFAMKNFYLGAETGFDLLPRDDIPPPPPKDSEIMATIAEMQASVNIIETATGALQTAVPALIAENKRLNDLIAAGPVLTPVEQAAIDELGAKLKVLGAALTKLATPDVAANP